MKDDILPSYSHLHLWLDEFLPSQIPLCVALSHSFLLRQIRNEHLEGLGAQPCQEVGRGQGRPNLEFALGLCGFLEAAGTWVVAWLGVWAQGWRLGVFRSRAALLLSRASQHLGRPQGTRPRVPLKRQGPALSLSAITLTQRTSSLHSLTRPPNDNYNDFFPTLLSLISIYLKMQFPNDSFISLLLYLITPSPSQTIWN